MKLNPLIIRILRKMKTSDGVSTLDALVRYLSDVEKLSIPEIASLLNVSKSMIYKILKNKARNFNTVKLQDVKDE